MSNLISMLTQFEPIEQRSYFDQTIMNKPVDYVHPFEEYVPAYGRQLTPDGQILMTMIQRHLADYFSVSLEKR